MTGIITHLQFGWIDGALMPSFNSDSLNLFPFKDEHKSQVLLSSVSKNSNSLTP